MNKRISFELSKTDYVDFYGQKAYYNLILLDGQVYTKINPISCDDVIGQRNSIVEILENKIKKGEL